MSAALQQPLFGPNTVDDWLAKDQPDGGSRLELILGYFIVSPPPGVEHQYAGDELRAVLKGVLRAAGRTDLYAVTAVGVEISSGWRTGLIPDIVVIDVLPRGNLLRADNLTLVVEIWSPGNSHGEREDKIRSYAAAGVPFLWTVEFDKSTGQPSVTAHRLAHGEYVPEVVAKPGVTTTIEAAPVPVMLDPADLLP